MGSNNKNRKEIILDLTSLLDVVFIVLLIVMVGQKQKMSECDSDSASYNAAYEAYSDISDSYANTDMYVSFISVVSYYNEADPQERTVKILSGIKDKEMDSYELSGAYNEVIFDNIEVQLKELVAQQEGIPVFLSLNSGDSKILYRDELVLKDIIEDIQNENELVFYKKGTL